MNGVDYDIPAVKAHMPDAVRRAMPFAIACTALLLSMASSVRAEPRRASPQPEDILPQSELDDPIGIDSE
jgi:hypothetical protein